MLERILEVPCVDTSVGPLFGSLAGLFVVGPVPGVIVAVVAEEVALAVFFVVDEVADVGVAVGEDCTSFSVAEAQIEFPLVIAATLLPQHLPTPLRDPILKLPNIDVPTLLESVRRHFAPIELMPQIFKIEFSLLGFGCLDFFACEFFERELAQGICVCFTWRIA